MNFHPILVHFPIALLTLYALLEVLPLEKLLRSIPWFALRAATAIVGTLASYLAYATGDESNPMFASGALRVIRHAHENWAAVTVAIFTALAAYYLVELVRRDPRIVARLRSNSLLKGVWALALWCHSVLNRKWLLVLLALAGLVAVTITGALGGSLVYGRNVDPVVSAVYSLLGL